MTTQRTDTMAMTDHELEQINGGAFPLIPFLVLGGVLAGVVWGAGKVLDGLDELPDPKGGSKKRSGK